MKIFHNLKEGTVLHNTTDEGSTLKTKNQKGDFIMQRKMLFKDIANVVPSIVAIAAKNYIPELNLHADNFTIINIAEMSAKGISTLFDREVLSIETTPNNLLYIVLGNIIDRPCT